MVLVRLGEAEDKIPISEEADVWNTVLKTIGEGLLSPSICTEVGGNIVSSTTWDVQGSPYFVSSTITVKSGITLTVTSDVVVMLQKGSKLDSELTGKIHFIGSNISVIPYDGRCE